MLACCTRLLRILAAVVKYERLSPEEIANRTPGASDLFIPLPFSWSLSAMGMDGFEKNEMGW